MKPQEVQILGRKGGTVVLSFPSEDGLSRVDIRLNPPRENSYSLAPVMFQMPAARGGGVDPRMLIELLLAHSKFMDTDDAQRANYQACLLAGLEELDRIETTNNGDQRNG